MVLRVAISRRNCRHCCNDFFYRFVL